MKKSIKKSVLVISFVLVMVIMAVALVACDKTDKKLLSMQNSISYYCDQMLVAEDGNFYVEYIKGEKEVALIADGEIGEMATYCQLNVAPVNLDMTNRTITFKLSGDKGFYEGTLEKNILGINFNANISEPQNLGEIKSLTLTVGEESFEYELKSISAEPLDCKKVVENIYNNCSDDLEGMFDGNNFDREIYIKVSCDRLKQPKSYYWFVNIVENSENMFCVLVDMETGEIVAKKHK